jgi:predicted transcriptional regulator
MEVHFTPEQEAQLAQIANHNGTAPEQLVKEAVNRMLENQARFIAGVEKGIAAADRGDLVDHDEIKNRVNRRFES